jgi:demethylmenaquinone methyltransferase/2-methoxy-6-polyprenyl-1,4-benzoquinol methylase
MIRYLEKMQRVTRSKGAAKVAYNRMSKWYDILTMGAENKCRRAGLELLQLKNGEIVLEIGVGTGRAIIEIARSVGHSGIVFGIDLSDRMIMLAQSRASKAGLEAKVELLCRDAAILPYNDESLNAIFMSFTLELFDTPEIDPLLQQCKRTLKNDGRICIVSMSRQGQQNWALKIYEWAHARFPNYVDCRPIYAERLLHSAGFNVEEKRAYSLWGLPVELVLARKN